RDLTQVELDAAATELEKNVIFGESLFSRAELGLEVLAKNLSVGTSAAGTTTLKTGREVRQEAQARPGGKDSGGNATCEDHTEAKGKKWTNWGGGVVGEKTAAARSKQETKEHGVLASDHQHKIVNHENVLGRSEDDPEQSKGVTRSGTISETKRLLMQVAERVAKTSSPARKNRVVSEEPNEGAPQGARPDSSVGAKSEIKKNASGFFLPNRPKVFSLRRGNSETRITPAANANRRQIGEEDALANDPPSSGNKNYVGLIGKNQQESTDRAGGVRKTSSINPSLVEQLPFQPMLHRVMSNSNAPGLLSPPDTGGFRGLRPAAVVVDKTLVAQEPSASITGAGTAGTGDAHAGSKETTSGARPALEQQLAQPVNCATSTSHTSGQLEFVSAAAAGLQTYPQNACSGTILSGPHLQHQGLHLQQQYHLLPLPFSPHPAGSVGTWSQQLHVPAAQIGVHPPFQQSGLPTFHAFDLQREPYNQQGTPSEAFSAASHTKRVVEQFLQSIDAQVIVEEEKRCVGRSWWTNGKYDKQVRLAPLSNAFGEAWKDPFWSKRDLNDALEACIDMIGQAEHRMFTRMYLEEEAGDCTSTSSEADALSDAGAGTKGRNATNFCKNYTESPTMKQDNEEDHDLHEENYHPSEVDSRHDFLTRDKLHSNLYSKKQRTQFYRTALQKAQKLARKQGLRKKEESQGRKLRRRKNLPESSCQPRSLTKGRVAGLKSCQDGEDDEKSKHEKQRVQCQKKKNEAHGGRNIKVKKNISREQIVLTHRAGEKGWEVEQHYRSGTSSGRTSSSRSSSASEKEHNQEQDHQTPRRGLKQAKRYRVTRVENWDYDLKNARPRVSARQTFDVASGRYDSSREEELTVSSRELFSSSYTSSEGRTFLQADFLDHMQTVMARHGHWYGKAEVSLRQEIARIAAGREEKKNKKRGRSAGHASGEPPQYNLFHYSPCDDRPIQRTALLGKNNKKKSYNYLKSSSLCDECFMTGKQGQQLVQHVLQDIEDGQLKFDVTADLMVVQRNRRGETPFLAPGSAAGAPAAAVLAAPPGLLYPARATTTTTLGTTAMTTKATGDEVAVVPRPAGELQHTAANGDYNKKKNSQFVAAFHSQRTTVQRLHNYVARKDKFRNFGESSFGLKGEIRAYRNEDDWKQEEIRLRRRRDEERTDLKVLREYTILDKQGDLTNLVMWQDWVLNRKFYAERDQPGFGQDDSGSDSEHERLVEVGHDHDVPGGAGGG
ncbi:unnamed protein product, partial [Amoebophrya sp. A120]